MIRGMAEPLVIRGMTPALVTPVTDAGEVDEDSTARLIASVRPYADALLPALSTGEGGALTDGQWRSVVQATVRCAGGLPVLAGVLRPTTAETVLRARAARELGAAAVVATTPYGSGVTQEQMYRHFENVARAADLPVVVYHESAVSGNHLGPDTLLRLSRLPAVAAIKDSAGSAGGTRALVAARPGVPVLQGLEHLLTECGPVDGCVAALANVEPALCARLAAALPTGRVAPRTAERLRTACARYGLDGDDWYRSLKKELCARGVLNTDREVPQ